MIVPWDPGMKDPLAPRTRRSRGVPWVAAAGREFPNVKTRAPEVCHSSHLRASSALGCSRGTAWKMVLTSRNRQRESTNTALTKTREKREINGGKCLKGREEMFKR